jgi:transcriptional regulator with XRE-family HTH domain
LTLEELAERAKVSGKFVQSIETGRQSPTIDTVEKLARGLNVAIYELLVIDERSPATLRARARELISEATDAEIGRIVRVLEATLH